MAEQTDDAFLTVRIPRDLHAALKEIAKREDRTVTAHVRRVLQQHVDSRQEETA